MKPILFLLKSDFHDSLVHKTQKFYCPHCAMLEGVLYYYPQLRELLDVRYVDFPKPRTELVQLLGEAHQGCPLLIVTASNSLAGNFEQQGDFRFTHNNLEIATFLAQQFGVGIWHP